jgi:hypothetical protein
MTDTELLDYLESLFAGKFRNSLFISHEPSDFTERRMLTLDIRDQHAVVHRAKTVRGAIKLAMEWKEDEV